MQRLFFGIYGAILVSTLLVLALSYYALSTLNQFRYQLHLQEVMEGTSILLSRGVARQAPENQQRWIELASSLLDANLTVSNTDLSAKKIYKVFLNSQIASNNTEKYQVRFQSSNNNQLIQLEFDGVTEHILTATAFFMLNELGRLPPDQRQNAFDEYKQIFNYDISRIQQQDLDLDSRQLIRLQRGETVVAVKRQLGQGLAFNVYAPWGKTTDALVLGPIAFFDPFPTYIAAPALSIALLVMAILVMLIIRKLGNRLTALQDKVDAIRPEYIGTDIEKNQGKNIENTQEDDTEVVTALSNKIQNMAIRIEKLLEEKAHMIRAVSHDLRTPIAKIHFRLEALTTKLGDDNKLIRGCHDDLRQLNLLIDELLTYEKLSIKQNIEFKSLDLEQIIQGQIDGVKVLHPALNITFIRSSSCITGAASPYAVEGNEVLINRMIENLLNNAARHTKNNINVSMSCNSAQLQISIEDDGEGILESALEHLFEPFFRADASRTAGKGGYGLGLAIVKQVVLQHNGEVSASNNEQGGACFRVTLPFKAAPL